jgi:hypothetical protein
MMITYPHMTFVVAAGNVGAYRTIMSPGTATAAITVGNAALTSQADGGFRKTLRADSSRGPLDTTFEIKPDVLAHGDNVFSSLPSWRTSLLYGEMGGTSQASPHVAGAVALMKQYSRENFGVAWTSQEIKSRIMNTAMPVSLGSSSNSVFGTGAGYIDAFAAIHADTIVSVNYDRVSMPHAPSSPYSFSHFAAARTGSFSFGGTLSLNENVERAFSVQIENQSDASRTYTIGHRFITNLGEMILTFPESVYVPAGGTAEFNVVASINAARAGIDPGIFEGFVYVRHEGEIVARLPFAYAARTMRTLRHGGVLGGDRVTSADATLLAQWLAHQNVTINLRAADINCDGKVDLNDLIRLAQVLVGQYKTFCPHGGCWRCNNLLR